MVFYQNNEWHLSTYKVVYTDDGEQLENTVGQVGKDWWLELEKLWSNILIIKFEEVSATDEQKIRLERVNRAGITDGFSSSVSEYVRNGKFPDGFSHVLKDVEVEEFSQSQGISLSEREIEALYLAVQVSELELQVLELGGGV